MSRALSSREAARTVSLPQEGQRAAEVASGWEHLQQRETEGFCFNSIRLAFSPRLIEPEFRPYL
jgi:hypothetical protein